MKNLFVKYDLAQDFNTLINLKRESLKKLDICFNYPGDSQESIDAGNDYDELSIKEFELKKELVSKLKEIPQIKSLGFHNNIQYYHLIDKYVDNHIK